MWLILPVKSFGSAKQRLSGLLLPEERRLLARAMLSDLMEHVARARGLDGVVVVTREEEAILSARRIGAVILDDVCVGGQSAAVAQGAAFLKHQGIDTFLTVPGDLPLLTAGELEDLMAVHGEMRGVTLAPARDRYGTNGMILSPPDAMTLKFGPDSFVRHLEEARRAGLATKVVMRSGFDLDIDTPDDLFELLRRGPVGRVAEVVARLNLSSRATSSGISSRESVLQP